MYDLKSECYFIVNPRAGSGKTMYQWVPAEKKLERLAIPYITALTDHKRHATELAKEAAAAGYRKIFAVGGDGSLHEVFNGICAWCAENNVSTEEFYLGVVPIGSGNDWIKSLGIKHDVDEAIELIAGNSFTTMDVIRVKSDGAKVTYMANIGGVGFDSHVCQRVNSLKERGRRGKMIYLNSLRYTISTLRAINISLIADGAIAFSGQVYSIALGNGKYSGSGMRQVPLADMNDEMIDFTIVPKVPIRKIVKDLPRLFRGNLHHSENVITGRCRSLQIVPMDANSNDIIELDGEIVGNIPLSADYIGLKINVLTGR